MHRNSALRAGAATALLSLVVVAATASASGRDVKARQRTAQSALKLSSERVEQFASTPAGILGLLATRIAADAGDPSPTGAAYVVASRRAANAADNGDQLNLPDEEVYYVVLHGHFIARNAFVPPGSPPPTGSVIGFTVDPQTYDILDYSLSDKARDIGRFGRPIRLAVP
jgi:hypothetical protein